MNEKSRNALLILAMILAIGLAVMLPGQAAAHCDTLDGPVVLEARAALERGDVTPVLKWVRAENEQDIRTAFDKTLAVRKLNPEAQQLADMYFFETLVRIHRAGEGAPYTGLKAAGVIEPVVAKADQALAQGSVEGLAKAIAAHTEEGIKERFHHALHAQKHAAKNVEAGREYVEAYVTYVHYVEGIAQAVHSAPHHGAPPSPVAHQH